MAEVRLTKISNLIIMHCHDHSSFIGKECENEPLQDNMSVNLPHKNQSQGNGASVSVATNERESQCQKRNRNVHELDDDLVTYHKPTQVKGN